ALRQGQRALGVSLGLDDALEEIGWRLLERHDGDVLRRAQFVPDTLAACAMVEMSACCRRGELVEFPVEQVERRLVEAFAIHGDHLSARAYSSNSASSFCKRSRA